MMTPGLQVPDSYFFLEFVFVCTLRLVLALGPLALGPCSAAARGSPR